MKEITAPKRINKDCFIKLMGKKQVWMWNIYKENTFVFYYLDNLNKPYFISECKLNELLKHQ